MERLTLPKHHYFERIEKMQKIAQDNDFDAIIIVSDEAEPANVRYFTGYTPVFETAGILIPAQGAALLMTGPESIPLVAVHSVLKEHRKLLEFRESSDPEYPDIEHSTFDELFHEITGGRPLRKIGLIGTNIMTVQVYEGIKNAAKDAEVVKCDNFLRNMRMIKTADELALMRKAAQTAQKGFEYALSMIKPGMTELEATAEAISGVLKNGAESPGFLIWCVSGNHTNQPIGKSTYKVIEKNEIVQLTMGAMVDGYVSSFGRPFCFGQPPKEQLDLLKMGLEANILTHSLMREGANAGQVAKTVHGLVRSRGFGEFIVYGPAHCIGMMECEYPFVETISDYEMKAGMTYAVDTFLGDTRFGMRYEDTAAITETGEEQFAPGFREIIIL